MPRRELPVRLGLTAICTSAPFCVIAILLPAVNCVVAPGATAATLLPYVFSSAAWLRSGGGNGGRVVAALALVYSLYALSGAGTEALAWGVVLLLAGVPVYLWMRRVRAR